MKEFFSNWLLHRCQRAVESSPEDQKGWSKLAGIYAERGQPAEFVGFCREFLHRWPGSQAAWKFLRTAGEGIVSDADALQFTREIVRQHPDCERAWTQLDMDSEKLQSSAESTALYREIVAQHPSNLHAWSRLMRELKTEARHAELVSACLQAIKLKPDAQTWLNLAEAYAAQCKFDDAISAYQRALELKPTFLVALNGLGCLLHTLGRYEDAVEVYLKATELNKGDATPWAWLALAYMRLGKRQQAENAAAKVKKSLPMVADMLAAELESIPAETHGSEVTNARITVDRLAVEFPEQAGV